MIPLDELLDPTQPATPTPGELVPALPTLEGLTVGLMENTKPRSDALLRFTGEALHRATGCRLHFISKLDTTVAPPEVLRQLSARCHAIVTGIGD